MTPDPVPDALWPNGPVAPVTSTRTMLGMTLCATDATPVSRSCFTAEPVADTRSIVTPLFRGTANAPIAPPSSPAINAEIRIARHGARARGGSYAAGAGLHAGIGTVSGGYARCAGSVAGSDAASGGYSQTGSTGCSDEVKLGSEAWSSGCSDNGGLGSAVSPVFVSSMLSLIAVFPPCPRLSPNVCKERITRAWGGTVGCLGSCCESSFAGFWANAKHQFMVLPGVGG